MISYKCDACGKEITGSVSRLTFFAPNYFLRWDLHEAYECRIKLIEMLGEGRDVRDKK